MEIHEVSSAGDPSAGLSGRPQPAQSLLLFPTVLAPSSGVAVRQDSFTDD